MWCPTGCFGSAGSSLHTPSGISTPEFRHAVLLESKSLDGMPHRHRYVSPEPERNRASKAGRHCWDSTLSVSDAKASGGFTKLKEYSREEGHPTSVSPAFVGYSHKPCDTLLWHGKTFGSLARWDRNRCLRVSVEVYSAMWNIDSRESTAQCDPDVRPSLGLTDSGPLSPRLSHGIPGRIPLRDRAGDQATIEQLSKVSKLFSLFTTAPKHK